MALCARAADAFIAAPYIKAGTLSGILDSLAPDAHLICVSRWTPRDIMYGATDLACRTVVIERSGQFLLHSRLHAKYYRFGTQALLGSANLTRTGMNIDVVGNLEILCEAPTEFDTARFEQSILKEAFTVSDEEFALWSLIKPTQLAEEHSMSERTDMLDRWKPVTRRPEYLWLAYQQQGKGIPLEEQRQLAEWEVGLLGIPSGLTMPEFNNWLRLSLQASPFVRSVLGATGKPKEAVWDLLAGRWGITKDEAARSMATAQNWLSYLDI